MEGLYPFSYGLSGLTRVRRTRPHPDWNSVLAPVWPVFWANVLLKGAVTLISLPAIYLVRGERDISGG